MTMLRRTFLAAVLLAGMAAGASAWAGDAQATATVGIDNFTFSPPVLTIAKGTRVTWTNHDDIPHTVTNAQDPKMRSPVLDTDETYSLTFDKPGTYGFFCSLHPHMQSQVIVR
jgi:plastocyanin